MSEWFETLANQHDTRPLSQPTFCWVPHQSIIKIDGADAIKFLQGQVTCDVAALEVGQHCLGALCTNKGRVITVFRLFKTEQALLMRLNQSLVESVIQHLKKYAVFFKTQMYTCPDLCVIASTRATSSEQPIACLQIADQLHECWLERDQLDRVCADFVEQGLQPASEKQWLHGCIEQGLADVDITTTEVFLPHQLSLDKVNAISFKKGCYTGQEIVARTQYRGKSKRVLARITLDRGLSTESNDTITDLEGATLGQVVSSDQLEPTNLLAVWPIETEAETNVCVGGTPAAIVSIRYVEEVAK